VYDWNGITQFAWLTSACIIQWIHGFCAHYNIVYPLAHRFSVIFASRSFSHLAAVFSEYIKVTGYSVAT